MIDFSLDTYANFDPTPQSVPRARSFVLSQEWTTDEDNRARLATLTSEIVTNVVLHARTPFVVRVTGDSSCIRVAVSDGNTQPVVVKTHGPTSPTGRGLHIVKALSDRWGVDETAAGKTVWFELDEEVKSA
jgi:anti-sigma regulatory factor (Ser/Thr protein kinase)